MPIYEKYLEDLENRIDTEIEDKLTSSWIDFLDDKIETGAFSPKRGKFSPPSLEWPDLRINETLDDYDKMALHQYRMCSNILANGGGEPIGVRSNYGVSILPSLFGVELFVMDDEFNTLPTSKPLEGGRKTIRKLIGKGIPELNGELGEKTFEMGRKYLEIGKQYPKIGKYIHIYHPDLQGPMDVVEVLWGSQLFIDIIDESELVKEFLELVTETYICFMKKWDSIVPSFRIDGYSVHWGLMHKGHIMLRDDSAMNFSPEVFEEFIKPYNARLLNELGGGCMHFCGRGEHFVPIASEIEKLYAINMSQPEYNDMEKIYKSTVDKGVFIIGIPPWSVKEAYENGRDLKGRVYSAGFEKS